MFFRTLTADEGIQFRRWAREHYRPGEAIEGVWHPIVQAECVRMNQERAVFVAAEVDA